MAPFGAIPKSHPRSCWIRAIALTMSLSEYGGDTLNYSPSDKATG